MGRLIDADKYMAHLRANIDTTADIVDEQIKRDEPIGTVKDGGQIGYLMALQWARSSLELDCYTVEAIPKSNYEARLKADMMAMLEDLDLQIDESAAYNLEVAKVQRLIRDKINVLKGGTRWQ